MRSRGSRITKGMLIAGMIGLLAAGSSMAIVSAQQTGDPEDVVRAVIAAFNEGDAVTAASYFAEDATATGFFCPPDGTCDGRSEIQANLEREIAEGAQDDIVSLTVEGNIVSAQIEESAAGLAELGIERVVVNISATVVDGQIALLTDELDLTDEQTAKFAAALEQEEEPAVPAAGTGYAPSSRSWPASAALALVALGLAFTGASSVARRRSSKA